MNLWQLQFQRVQASAASAAAHPASQVGNLEKIWRKSDDFDGFDQLSAQVPGSQSPWAPQRPSALATPMATPIGTTVPETSECLRSVCCKKSIIFRLFYCWCSVGDWILVIMLSSCCLHEMFMFEVYHSAYYKETHKAAKGQLALGLAPVRRIILFQFLCRLCTPRTFKNWFPFICPIFLPVGNFNLWHL